MIFRSNFANFTAVVRHEIQIPHPTLPVIQSTIPALRAEFGQLGSEYQYENQDGSVTTHADIRGHFFDSVSAQEQNGWTNEEREEVERRLVTLAGRWPEAVQVIEQAKAEKPWPSYSEMDEEKVVEFALATGLVEEALRYEVENACRDLVVVKLRKALESQQTATAKDEEELAVA